jgi:hypothetical protein
MLASRQCPRSFAQGGGRDNSRRVSVPVRGGERGKGVFGIAIGNVWHEVGVNLAALPTVRGRGPYSESEDFRRGMTCSPKRRQPGTQGHGSRGVGSRTWVQEPAMRASYRPQCPVGVSAEAISHPVLPCHTLSGVSKRAKGRNASRICLFGSPLACRTKS